MNDSNPAAGRIWLRDYPPDVPAEIDPDSIPSLKHLYEDAFRRFAGVTAYANMGRSLSYADVDEQSRRFAAWLQKEAGPRRGDRVAIMMPNLLQYPIAIVGAHRAGCVVVNVNPLYTARELEHQLKDSGRDRDRHLRERGGDARAGDRAHAGAQGGRDRHRRPARLPEVRDHELRDPQGTQDGAGVLAAGRGALQRRARERRLARRSIRWTCPARTSPSCSTRAARPAFPRAPCSRTGTWSRTRCRSSPSCRSSRSSRIPPSSRRCRSTTSSR